MRREEFEKKYVTLRQTSPGHPLMSVISKGYTPLSCEYLLIALANPEAQIESPSKDSLFTRQGSLYSKRALLSNRLWDCISDVQRADLSMQIQDLQSQIINVKRDIAYVEKTGKLPPEKTKGRFVPEDGRSKEKKLKSVRTRISQITKQLKEERLKSSPDQRIINGYERRIDDFRAFAAELS
ncbi:MAG TPA: hypothetical protein VFG10_18870 [Saprospiraceae bacterium]|nr:hypothetical protein [Saprospiraceae bacterium]